jgi:hypothetical protein
VPTVRGKTGTDALMITGAMFVDTVYGRRGVAGLRELNTAVSPRSWRLIFD